MRYVTNIFLFALFLISKLNAAYLTSVTTQLEGANKICFLVANFNPITLQHENLISEILRNNTCSKVILIPSLSLFDHLGPPESVLLEVIHQLYKDSNQILYPTNSKQPIQVINSILSQLKTKPTLLSNFNHPQMKNFSPLPFNSSDLNQQSQLVKEKNYRHRQDIYFGQPEELQKMYETELKQDINIIALQYIRKKGIYLGELPNETLTTLTKIKHKVYPRVPSILREAVVEYLKKLSQRTTQQKDLTLLPFHYHSVAQGDLDVIKILGRGFFNNAYLVTMTNKQGQTTPYVLKISNKGAIFKEDLRNAYLSWSWLSQRPELLTLNNSPYQLHLPTIYDFQETDDHSFMLMEFIDGFNIEQLIANNDQLARKLAIPTFSVFQNLHDFNGMLLDINVDNLILRKSDQELFLIDTGLLTRKSPLIRSSDELYSKWKNKYQYRCLKNLLLLLRFKS